MRCRAIVTVDDDGEFYFDMPDGSTPEQIRSRAWELAENFLSVHAEEFTPPKASKFDVGLITNLLPSAPEIAARNRVLLEWLKKEGRIKR